MKYFKNIIVIIFKIISKFRALHTLFFIKQFENKMITELVMHTYIYGLQLGRQTTFQDQIEIIWIGPLYILFEFIFIVKIDHYLTSRFFWWWIISRCSHPQRAHSSEVAKNESNHHQHNMLAPWVLIKTYILTSKIMMRVNAT